MGVAAIMAYRFQPASCVAAGNRTPQRAQGKHIAALFELSRELHLRNAKVS
jgi:hypothetical protein